MYVSVFFLTSTANRAFSSEYSLLLLEGVVVVASASPTPKHETIRFGSVAVVLVGGSLCASLLVQQHHQHGTNTTGHQS